MRPSPGDDGAGGPRDVSGGTPRRVGRSTGRVAGRTARRIGDGSQRAARYAARRAMAAARAEGAGESGLSRLIGMHAVSVAGDAAVAISLAGTLFFQVPTDQARSQVALFLGLTMLPFAIVAPFIGPVLDRFGHGRRWAIGTTTAVRGFLGWVLAGAVATQDPVMFPAALGCLVASKAYGVTKAAAVPRLAPPQLTLVRTNARVSLAGVVGVAVSAPIAIVAAQFGSQWSLRYAFVLFVVATVLAILLPARVDSPAGDRERFGSMVHLAGEASGEITPRPAPRPTAPREGRRAGERTAHGSGREETQGMRERAQRGIRRVVRSVPGPVVVGLRSNAGLRLLSGFLTMYLAFLLREVHVPGWDWSPELLIGLVIGAAGAGNSMGIALGSVLRRVRPEGAVLITLVVDVVVTLVATVWFTLPTLLLLGLTAGVCQGFAKLSLDALIQREVGEEVRASTFARSETLLQLSWVVGGLVGITLPLHPRLGLAVATALLAACAVWAVSAGRPRRRVPGTALPH